MQNYHRALSISKDEDLELHLKWQPGYCFVNSYFDVGLKTLWEKIWTYSSLLMYSILQRL